MIYPLLRTLLFQIDPERIHDLTMKFTKFQGSKPWVSDLLRKQLLWESSELETQIGDLHFRNPVGLAAGLDKDGIAIQFMQELGFGHLEVGTVTPLPQPGNPKPRLFRLPEDQGIINRMGFNNHGVAKLAQSVANSNKKVPVGINLGKNKDTPLEEAASDYVKGLQTAWSAGDYFAINISSPNTQGLRSLQEEKALYPLIQSVMKTRDELTEANGKKKQIWLKIAPDVTEKELETITGIALDLNVDTLIVSNTTIGRKGLINGNKKEQGGLSGLPVKELSNQILKKTSEYTKGQIPLIGVGGIFSGLDAFEKITLGASMVQIYTGFIYEGPAVVKSIKKELTNILRQRGIKSISEAVGIALP
ncbi:MAG: dihydroorotate dehydrogenase [bacterium]|jgi:dihydroorotate dehydrogenase